MTQDNSITGLGKTSTATTTKAKSTSTTNNESSSSSSTSSTQELGQEQFLTLLVTQLQHQDPLNPMESQEFAVQLAQFSQLEQLTQINDKLGLLTDSSGTTAATMAAFLGNEVVLSDAQFSVADGTGSNLLVDIPEGTSSVRVDLMDAGGTVMAQKTLDDFETGQQVLKLEGLDVADGNYEIRVVSVDATGGFTDLDAKVTGTVEGFVLGDEPKLLIGGNEVSLDSVVEVYRGSNS